jgi:hypothetical protein
MPEEYSGRKTDKSNSNQRVIRFYCQSRPVSVNCSAAVMQHAIALFTHQNIIFSKNFQ